MGLVFMMYAQDYDEKFCPGEGQFNLPSNPNATVAWDTYTEPYAIKAGAKFYGDTSANNPFLRCPSDAVARTGGSGIRSYAVPWTYDGNRNLAWKPAVTLPGGNYSEGRVLPEFSDAGGTILLAEYPTAGNRLATNLGYRVAGPNTSLIHFDGANYLFVDGHVKWLRPASTASQKTLPFTNADGFNCQASNRLSSPCGMWTITADD